jgi:hypothetical protein
MSSNKLISVKVLLADGTTYTTDVHRSLTDEEIRAYFVGADINYTRALYSLRNEIPLVRCTGVEIDRS